MEVFLKLDASLDQTAGIMSLQNFDGREWDGIGFGKGSPTGAPLRWFASSPGNRTNDQGGAAETLAKDVIHIAITWGQGATHIYRQGKTYYKFSMGYMENYHPNNSKIVFGITHATKEGGFDAFNGTLVEARLYGRVLTDEEIAASFFAFTECPASMSICRALKPILLMSHW